MNVLAVHSKEAHKTDLILGVRRTTGGVGVAIAVTCRVGSRDLASLWGKKAGGWMRCFYRDLAVFSFLNSVVLL